MSSKTKIMEVRHHRQLADAIRAIHARSSLTFGAMQEFEIVTGACPHDTPSARLSEIDFESNCWNVQSHRTENNEPHYYSLGKRALKIAAGVKYAKQFGMLYDGDLMFCNPKTCEQYSDAEIMNTRSNISVTLKSGIDYQYLFIKWHENMTESSQGYLTESDMKTIYGYHNHDYVGEATHEIFCQKLIMWEEYLERKSIFQDFATGLYYNIPSAVEQHRPDNESDVMLMLRGY